MRLVVFILLCLCLTGITQSQYGSAITISKDGFPIGKLCTFVTCCCDKPETRDTNIGFLIGVVEIKGVLYFKIKERVVKTDELGNKEYQIPSSYAYVYVTKTTWLRMDSVVLVQEN
jgi:hypothetical protein